ncbi:MAG: glycerophosphodiester phosphodiesterase [Deltaproteobacteria bacterium]|nr:glycerophosphodiester phosphodiesterase [Deltaproteobacteria bacterium]MBW2131102.1 glycerophosphodiester phosphodiesterase [Deltaproteobacteria bacterium]
MILVGHRGAAGLAPENTLAAFRKALEFNVDGIEMDVQLSADQQVVVHHDFTLKPEITRTADGRWISEKELKPIKELTLSELKSYDVGRLKSSTGYARRYPDQQPADGERIPTLPEVIALLKGRKDAHTGLWLEIKTSPEAPELSPDPGKMVEAVAMVLKSEDFLSRAHILSFDWRALVYCRKRYPQIPVVFLSDADNFLEKIRSAISENDSERSGLPGEEIHSIPQIIHHLGGRRWGPRFDSLTPQALAEAQGLEIQVFPWTADNRNDITRLVGMDVDGIITNRPDVFRSLYPSP